MSRILLVCVIFALCGHHIDNEAENIWMTYSRVSCHMLEIQKSFRVS